MVRARHQRFFRTASVHREAKRLLSSVSAIGNALAVRRPDGDLVFARTERHPPHRAPFEVIDPDFRLPSLHRHRKQAAVRGQSRRLINRWFQANWLHIPLTVSPNERVLDGFRRGTRTEIRQRSARRNVKFTYAINWSGRDILENWHRRAVNLESVGIEGYGH